MLKTVTSKIAVGMGLAVLFLTLGAKAAEEDQWNAIQKLEDTGKLLFKLADTNNDNRISQKEAIDAGNLLVGGFFFRADANGDGTVTAAEAAAARESLFNQRPLLRLIFQRSKDEINQQGGVQVPTNQPGGRAQKLDLASLLDTNHDGSYSAPEVRQAVQNSVQSLFMMADRNGDGQLDPAEVNQAILEIARTAVQTAFNSADTDRSGTLSQAEFDKAIMNPAHVFFRILDANNDNQISQDEMRSGMQTVMRELKAMNLPEPPNSLSNRIRNMQNTPAPASGTYAPAPATAPPAQPVSPAPGTYAPAPMTVPIQPVAPTPGTIAPGGTIVPR
ncbi:MAG: EF-hand domain-containing protein [Planctomycetaceae bacterium]|nr:EF-hand domain-containing protein [Planctomycetaceae bacterium]